MKSDLSIEQANVRKLLENHGTLSSVYKEIRAKTQFQPIGDYMIVAFICDVAKNAGIAISKESIIKALRITADGEFKKVRQSSEIVRQLCA